MARLKEENIPWDALAKLGITKDYLVQSNNLDNLLNYQKNIIRTPFESEKTVELNYDIHNYLKDVYVNNVHPLEKRKHTLSMTT